jgi:hypothetical protein
MITNKGKSIIAKYMLGQAPAYASYLAVGCGPTPLQTEDVADNFATKKNLDFEMFRVPISSRGFVNENGIDKIVLTAELPTEERYEITEVGLYSAGSNPSAGAQDSKTVFAFTQGENWEYHTASSSIAIPPISVPLDPDEDDIINAPGTENGVFQTNADNSIFYNTDRVARYERPRFLNNTILMQGDDSDLSDADGSGAEEHIAIDSGNHIHLTSPNVDFSQNSPLDELRFAFSLINRDGTSAANPDTIRILIDFAATDSNNPSTYARFEVNIEDGVDGYDFETNRYFVVSKQLQELYKSQNFTWNAVTVVKIYVSVFDSLSGGLNPTSDYYIALDALRLENVATVNPLYGLTGYSVIKNDNATTIIKSPNTNNYVEFRFSIGVT